MTKWIGVSILLMGGLLLQRTVAPAQSVPVPPFESIRKIDVHSHIFEDIPELPEMLRRVNLTIINVCNRGNDPEVLTGMDKMARLLQDKYGADVLPFGATFDLTRRYDSGYADHVRGWLDGTFQAGALLVKIWKDVGLELKGPDGKFTLPDDPIFDPVYSHLAAQDKPLLAHLAEPLAAWLPLDPENVHYGYYSRNPQWHLYGKPEYPSHAEIIAARDRILEKHPNLVIIGAHMGSLSHDVDEVAKRLDRYPNFYVECSARTADLSRQPREKVRDFFIRYQDRILYGLDMTRRLNPEGSSSADERRAWVDMLEQRYRLDYQYYAGSGTVEYRGKSVESLHLPKEVLEKFYHRNAQRLMPALTPRGRT